MKRTRTLLAVLAMALPIPAAIAGCGGGGSSDESPQGVIDQTFNNDQRITSGVLDVSLNAKVEGDQGGEFTASLSGPFQGDPQKANALPQLDLTGEVSGSGGGQDVNGSAEITVTDDDAFITYQDQAYEVGKDTFSQFKSQLETSAPDSSTDTKSFTEQFKQGCEDAIKAQKGDASACNFDVSQWFSDLSNDGTEDVEGTETTHISGGLNVEQMLSDLLTLGSSVPGANAGGISPDLLKSQLGTITNAVDNASFGVYSGSDDNLLRKLDFTIELDPASIPGAAQSGIGKVSLGFNVTLSGVNETQTIEAPSNPKPISDLEGALGSIPGLGSSIPGLGGGAGAGAGGAGTLPGAGAGSGNTDAYLKCIGDAKTTEEINACSGKL